MPDTEILISAVSRIDIVQLFAGDSGQLIDLSYVGGFPVRHMEAGEEPGDMQGNTFSDPHSPPIGQSGDPFRELSHLFFRIIFTGDDKGRQFYMTGTDSPFYKSQDSFQVSLQHIFVITLGEAFQVDIHGVDKGQELLQYVQLSRPVRDEDIFHAFFMDELCRIEDKLISDQGFIVSKCDADVALLPVIRGCPGEFFRCQTLCGIRKAHGFC